MPVMSWGKAVLSTNWGKGLSLMEARGHWEGGRGLIPHFVLVFSLTLTGTPGEC